MILQRLDFFLYMAIISFFIGIFYLIKKKMLSLKYSLMWLLSGVVILLIILFQDGFIRLMNKLGIVNASNGLFAICVFMFMIMLLMLTSVISKMNAKIKSLTQSFGILEKKVRELEERRNEG